MRGSAICISCPPGVSLVTSEGQFGDLREPEENDDEDRGELSRLAGLHLGLADVKDAFDRFTISKLYSSSFAPEVGQEVGVPLVGRVCPCFRSLPMGHTWSLLFCQKAIEEAVWTTPGLGKAEILQDNRSCVVQRPSDGRDDAESSHRASKRFFHVYVDNLGVLGTSRLNVDKDLMVAVHTLKSESGHT